MAYWENGILVFLHQAVDAFPGLRNLLNEISAGYLLKGCTVMSFYWMLWFYPTEEGDEKTRKTLVAAIVGAILAFLVARLLGALLPYRPRPIQTPNFPFPVPPGMQDTLRHWSSFPSDHAAIFTALALGVAFVNWRLGGCLFIYLLGFVFMPRIYRGLHYPVDIFAGVLLGAVVGVTVNLDKVKRLIVWPVFWFKDKYPAFFYWLAFLLIFQIATLFDDVRKIIDSILDLAK